jgi:hypothetical protein
MTAVRIITTPKDFEMNDIILDNMLGGSLLSAEAKINPPII